MIFTDILDDARYLLEMLVERVMKRSSRKEAIKEYASDLLGISDYFCEKLDAIHVGLTNDDACYPIENFSKVDLRFISANNDLLDKCTSILNERIKKRFAQVKGFYKEDLIALG